MTCIFLYNPNSGKGKLLTKLDYIEQRLKEKYSEVVMYPTKSREDTIQTAKESCGKYDAIIFSGGDGTFNDVTCGVSSESVRPVLGYIPSGTVNDIARNLKIPKNLKKALNVILYGNIKSHDVGIINEEKHFMYVTALGTFTEVSYSTKQKNKRMLGKVAYILNGIHDVINPSLVEVKVINESGIETTHQCPLFLVMNSISVGGIPFNKNGHLNDGYFDVIFVKKYIGRGIVAIAHMFLLGIRKKKRTKYYEVMKCKKFTIQVDDQITWCIDGEKGPTGTISIRNLHNHLQIYVPNEKGYDRRNRIWTKTKKA